jgi:hypothetical protein
MPTFRPLRRRVDALLLVGSLALLSAACATHARPAAVAPEPGAVVRVVRRCEFRRQFSTCPSYKGQLVVLGADSITLTTGPAAVPLSLSLTEVATLEVRVGQRSALEAGLGIGIAVGVIVGTVVTPNPCTEYQGSWPCYPPGLFYGALIGAALGGAIGATTHRDRWTPVPVARSKTPR